MKKAVICDGKVQNIIECDDAGLVGLRFALGTEVWDCGAYDAAIGDGFADGVFLRQGSALQPVRTTEQRVTALETTVYPSPPSTLAEAKAARIQESKAALAAHLETHPLLYTDQKRYSVTREKQSLLIGALTRHQIAVAAGLTPTLHWNATGAPCTVWTYTALTALALAIAAYVEPLVARQQEAEVAINACLSIEAVGAVVITHA